jgi:hypothetical protein
MFHVNRYQMLEVMRAMRRERIFRDRTNPLEIYDDLELIERFRFDRRTILQSAPGAPPGSAPDLGVTGCRILLPPPPGLQ